MQESIFEMSSNGEKSSEWFREHRTLNDQSNSGKKDVVNVIKMKGPLEPYLVLSQVCINAVPIHLRSHRPCFLSPDSGAWPLFQSCQSSLSPAQHVLNYCWTECHPLWLHRARAQLTERKYLLALYLLSDTLITASSATATLSLFSHFLRLSCCVNTLLNHIMDTSVFRTELSTRSLREAFCQCLAQTLAHLKYDKWWNRKFAGCKC